MRTRSTTTIAALAAVVALLIGLPFLSVSILGSNGDGSPSSGASPTTEPRTSDSRSDQATRPEDLPHGADPKVAYANGRRVITSAGTLQLPSPVVALDVNDYYGVAVTADSSVWGLSLRAASTSKLGEGAVGAPALNSGIAAWVERNAGGDSVVLTSLENPNNLERTEPPEGLTATFTIDIDQFTDVYIGNSQSTWLWNPSGDVGFQAIRGTEGSLVAVNSDGIILQEPRGVLTWGYVDSSGQYHQSDSASAKSLRFSSRGVVAIEDDGRLVQLSSTTETTSDEDGVTRLVTTVGDRRLAFDLDSSWTINSIVGETGTNFLADVTADDGGRAWVRCQLEKVECEFVVALDPASVTPGT